MFKQLSDCCKNLLMPSLPNFPTFISMTQETNQIITQLEIKRSLLTKQLELWDQSYGTR